MTRAIARRTLLSRLVLPLVVVAAAYLALLVWGRFGDLGAALRGFRLAYMAPVIGLVLANYALRFLRWQYYLRLLDVRLPRRESAGVFFSGFAMSITPARVGELLKCVLLRDGSGVKLSLSVPLVVSDRVSDLLAVCLLIGAGMLRYSAARGAAAAAIALVAAAAIALAFSPRIAAAAARVFTRRLARDQAVPAENLHQAAAVFARLLRGRALAYGTALGVLAWFAECAALYLVLGGLGSSAVTLYGATFVYALATLGGAVSLLPGGLGVTELGMTALLVAFGTSRETAVASVLIVRLCTLWLAAALGVVVYLLYRHAHRDRLVTADASAPVVDEGPDER